MNYETFVKEFAPLAKAYGTENFPQIMFERIYLRLKDLDPKQRQEVYGLLIDNCKFAPKVPDVIEYASLVRNRHREFEPTVADFTDRRGDPEAVAKVRNLISIAFGNKGDGAS